MAKFLHVVAPNVPMPSDAGVMKDLVYIIRALHGNEIRVQLHCHGNGENQVLAPYCDKIHYYPIKNGHEGYSLQIPHAVSSRSNDTLFCRLMTDNHPILFAGFQTIFPLLTQLPTEKRSIVVRVLRNEEKYFKDLSKIYPWGIKKLFCKAEAMRYRKSLNILVKKGIQLASAVDLEHFPNTPSTSNFKLVDQFRSMPFMMQSEGSGNYCFFHGNLGEPENEFAALWLLNNVFDTLLIPFVIGGDNPSSKLEKAAHLRSHTCLVANPSEKELQDLIKKAQINLLPSFVTHGSSFNLHQALALGRHVVTNTAGVWEKDIGSLCHIANLPSEFKLTTESLFTKNTDPSEHEKRASFLNINYKNESEIQTLIKMLY